MQVIRQKNNTCEKENESNYFSMVPALLKLPRRLYTNDVFNYITCQNINSRILNCDYIKTKKLKTDELSLNTLTVNTLMVNTLKVGGNLDTPSIISPSNSLDIQNGIITILDDIIFLGNNTDDSIVYIVSPELLVDKIKSRDNILELSGGDTYSSGSNAGSAVKIKDGQELILNSLNISGSNLLIKNGEYQTSMNVGSNGLTVANLQVNNYLAFQNNLFTYNVTNPNLDGSKITAVQMGLTMILYITPMVGMNEISVSGIPGPVNTTSFFYQIEKTNQISLGQVSNMTGGGILITFSGQSGTNTNASYAPTIGITFTINYLIANPI